MGVIYQDVKRGTFGWIKARIYLATFPRCLKMGHKKWCGVIMSHCPDPKLIKVNKIFKETWRENGMAKCANALSAQLLDPSYPKHISLLMTGAYLSVMMKLSNRKYTFISLPPLAFNCSVVLPLSLTPLCFLKFIQLYLQTTLIF